MNKTREFTKEDRSYILQNEEKMSLEDLGKHFNCSWKEVYEAYTDTFDFGEHKKYMFEKYCETVRKQLQHAEKYEVNKAESKIKSLEKMTATEIDGLIDKHIEELIKSLQILKKRGHEQFEDINKGVD